MAPGSTGSTGSAGERQTDALTSGLVLTLFRDGATVWDRRRVKLPAGDTDVVFTPVPEGIDARSATLVSLSAPDSISVRAREIPAGSSEPRSLTWTVTARKAGEHLLEAAYVTTHITWRAHYRLHVRPDASRPPTRDRADEALLGQLSGHLEISNHTTLSLKDALVRVADTRRVASDTGGAHRGKAGAGDAQEPQFQSLPRRISLDPRSTALVPLFDGETAPWPVAYGLLYDPVDSNLRGRSRKPKLRRDYGVRDEDNPRDVVRAIVELGARRPGATPGAETDLATLTALPEGQMTVVADSERGTPRIVGSGRAFERQGDAKSTHAEFGVSDSVRVTRRQTDFFLDEYAERLIEEIRVSLENRDTRPHRVLVREHMYRGRNWSVGYHNGVGNPRKIGVQTVRFDVELPPGESQTIVYRVIYTW